MKDINEYVEEVLNTVLPTYYELFLDNSSHIPCLSYKVSNNSEISKANTLCYERIIIRVKVWCTSIQDLCEYSSKVDDAIATLGPFTRSTASELNDGDLLCRIIDYVITLPEKYSTTRYL